MQGRPLTERQKHRILELLSETDLSMKDIAQSVQCSRSAVISFNQKHGVRRYQGNRSRWSIVVEKLQVSETTTG